MEMEVHSYSLGSGQGVNGETLAGTGVNGDFEARIGIGDRDEGVTRTLHPRLRQRGHELGDGFVCSAPTRMRRNRKRDEKKSALNLGGVRAAQTLRQATMLSPLGHGEGVSE
ncbi:hypothetical protein PIB30_001534 [Stylosanthes scabra]|uniref:Uncharacterized protein n=1 Tax=Stylosanthes scabra TaxID=79078 RepID=A0ABU6R351_9FABA|nr:hypothetical protein [Stylosanthes scabra]